VLFLWTFFDKNVASRYYPTFLIDRPGCGCHPMKAEGHFDGFGVAAQRAIIAGHMDAAALPRVADLLAAEAGDADIEYRIAGSADAAGRPALEVSLSGSLPLTCQRCLLPFRWPVQQKTLLLLARDERELARIDDEDHEHEAVRADAPLEVVALVEDELLLTLPFAPRCPEADCPAAQAGRAGAAAMSSAPSAFGALAELKAVAGKPAPR
jgi:uncharacterized protein